MGFRSPGRQASPQLIDLSHSYSSASPHLPDDAPVCLRVAGDRGRDGYLDHRVDIQEHSGTHLDAPLHFADGGASVAEIAVETLCGPLALIDIADRARSDPQASVSRSDVERWEDAHGRLSPGAIVFMRSGWFRRWSSADRYFGTSGGGRPQAPGWTLAAVEFLLRERDVSGIGVDTCSIDPLGGDGYPVHRAWLGAGKWAVENLANLDAVPASGAVVIVGVPRISGCTGFPARVVAMI